MASAFQTKVAVVWLVVLGFSLVNINILASWYNKSATIQPTDLAGVPVSNSFQAREVRSLLKQVNSLTNEHSRFRYEIVGQIDGLKKKIDALAMSSRSGPLKDRIFRVHLWDDSTPYGRREKKFYAKEGFATNPLTTLVDSPEDADIIVWVSVRGHMEKEIPPSNYSNVVLLDYAGTCSYVVIFCCCIASFRK